MGLRLGIFKRLLVMLLLSLPMSVTAQSFPVFDGVAGIGIVDQDALFSQSNAGRRYVSAFETAGKQLAAENLSIQQSLEVEERELTEIRKTLSSKEFEILAI